MAAVASLVREPDTVTPSPRILVADDQPEVREALRLLFKAEDYETTVVGSPAALLEALDGFAGRHGVGRMTTLVYASLRLATGELRYTCAGHPPPVVAPPGGEPYVLWDGRSIPLDCIAVVHSREEGVATLEPGAVLVLYTDGLVERRTGTLTGGIERLLRALPGHRDEPAARIASALLHELRDPEHADDVCVLAARFRGG